MNGIDNANTSTTTLTAAEFGELNEKTWFGIGSLSHAMDEWDKALVAYESALRHNPASEKTLHSLGRLLLDREQFGPAVEVFQRLMSVTKHPNEHSEEYLAEIAICWLGMEDIGKSGVFIQKAVEIGNEINRVVAQENGDGGGDKELEKKSSKKHSPILWYALGIYHDRLGNEDATMDAYLAFIESERNNPNEISDRAREIYYRLGVIYRLMGKLKESRECFDFVRRQLAFCVRPTPSAQNQVSGPCHIEVLMQLALIDEAEGEVKRARLTLEKLLSEASSQGGPMNLLFRCRNLVPKIRRELGCLALTQPTVFENDSSALALLLKATEEDPQDSLNWYYLGRLYLQLRQPTKAYDAYQQAVYRDGRNAAFWNSIGLLYFNIGQFRDALDALTRAVHHAPHSSTLWWNLGLLYESCHGAGSEDAREAFQKGFEYARSRNEPTMLAKFEGKKQRDPETSSADNINALDQMFEMDANRFVIRTLAAFPRPQSAASMSRFLTYRGQQAQAAQAQGLRRQPPGVGLGPIPAPSASGYPPQMRIPMSSAAAAGAVPMRPPMRPNVYGYPSTQPQYR